MIEARLQGTSLNEIGKSFGLTRERVRQILEKSGGPTTADVRRLQADIVAKNQVALTTKIREALRSGPLSAEEVAKAIGSSVAEVSRFWPHDLRYLRIRPATWAKQEWTDDAIFAAIRDASTYVFPLTASAYAELLRVGQIHGPSISRIGQRYGTWAAACDAAGVESGQPGRDNYQSRWTDEELLTYARDYFLDPESPSSAAGYGEWRRSNSPEAPSGKTLRNRFGTWAEIKRRALLMGGIHD